MKRERKNFDSYSGNGFRISFLNGWGLSVQWGGGTYSENHNNLHLLKDLSLGKATGCGSNTAETAIIDPDGNLWGIPGDMDTVQGYQTPEQVLETLNWVASFGPKGPKRGCSRGKRSQKVK